MVSPLWLLEGSEGQGRGSGCSVFSRTGRGCPRRAGSWGLALRLTVGWQVEDQVDHEGDEHTGHQDVDDVEERLAADDEVEGDILAVATVQRGTGVHVDPGRPMHYLPLPVL